MKKITMIIIVLLVGRPVLTQDITGQWNGMLHVQGMQLRLVFHLSNTGGQYSATLDSPDQNAKGIPVSSVTFEDSTLSVELLALGARYQGIYSADRDVFEGTFSQAGQTFPLDLGRDALERKVLRRPQEPQKPYPYRSEDVTFPGGDETVQLAGTLTLPLEKGRYPAVILISGSGPQNRNEEFMTHKPFLVLADHLTRKGIAVLRYDDRGVAQSTGDQMSATSGDLADDVLAAVQYLKSRSEIHPKHIGLIGHSEGGLIAPMVAAGSEDVDFIILLAGPGVPGGQILLQQVSLSGRVLGKDPSTIEKEMAVTTGAFELVVQCEEDELLRENLYSYFSESPYFDGLIPEGMDRQQFMDLYVNQLTRPWTKYFLRYDPATSLSKVRCPVLALNGSKDVQVSPENLKAIGRTLTESGNGKVTIREFAGMNHLFQECESGIVSEYATIEQTMALVVLEEISNWIVIQVR